MEKRENVKDSEFTQTSVPASQKKSFWEICVVWIGYVFVVTGMQVGGTMGISTDFATLLKALAVGSIVLLILGSFMGLIALRQVIPLVCCADMLLVSMAHRLFHL